jgi:hypothetical protein
MPLELPKEPGLRRSPLSGRTSYWRSELPRQSLGAGPEDQAEPGRMRPVKAPLSSSGG